MNTVNVILLNAKTDNGKAICESTVELLIEVCTISKIKTQTHSEYTIYSVYSISISLSHKCVMNVLCTEYLLWDYTTVLDLLLTHFSIPSAHMQP